jgi:thiamine biosynthesis lipoprotein
MCDAYLSLSIRQGQKQSPQTSRGSRHSSAPRHTPGFWRLLSLVGLTLLLDDGVLQGQTQESPASDSDRGRQVVERELQRFEAQRPAMGVLFKVVGYAENEDQARLAVQQAFDRVDALNGIFSDYDPESEISRLTRLAKPGVWQSVSPELYHVLLQARQVSLRSEGAFDVTVGPLSQFWRSVRKTRELPDPFQIDALNELVDFEALELHPFAHLIKLRCTGLQLDFGGIAKGFAADEALKVLHAQGIESALIDASGDISFSNPPPGRPAWGVAVAPLEKGGPPAFRLSMKGNAVATSGDAWQFVEIEGTRYSHIIDPRSGWALRGRQSVTVIAPTGAQADAWASALSVMGVARGLELVETLEGIEALYILAQGDRVVPHASKGFDEYVAP